MIRGAIPGFLLAANLLVAPCFLRAQVADTAAAGQQSADSQASDGGASPVPGDAGKNNGAPSSPASAVPVLGGDQILGLTRNVGRQLLYGISTTAGYSFSPTASGAGYQGPLSVLQPYVGFFEDGQRASMVLQYSPTIDVYDSHRWDGGGFHRTSLDGSYLLSRNWLLSYSGGSTYGSESARELATFSFTADTSTGLLLLNPSSIAIHNLSDNLLTVSGSASLAWQHTAKQQFSFMVRDSYGSYSTEAWSSNIVTTRAEMDEQVNPTVQWNTYAQVHSYTDEGCMDAGGGIGLRLKPSEKTSVNLEAGPQFGQSRCGTRVRADFSGSLVHLFTPRTTAYVRAGRDIGVTFLAGTEWVDNVSAGIQKQTSPNIFVVAQGGYLRSTGAVAGVNPAYDGYFISPEVRWRTRPTLELIGSYRYYRQNGFGDQYRSWVMCTLQWQPSTRAFSRTQRLEK